eukprot:TRINITY_DN69723_c0_g1_i1.p1 TRINITY_DN69723_c0_g1~~TRINITY_DN69723_c0_g1_i1.p1  ORF type:complete len:161 (-),score=22.75 TRINITY_DN69723_c0_g1_i1:317-799(-)
MMELDVVTDGSVVVRRFVCQAHGLAVCHMCCVDYGYMNEEFLDTAENEDMRGHFLTDKEIKQWFEQDKQKHPQIYEDDDTAFGQDSTQHAFGTRLLSYFDDDPARPIRLIIVGSRMAKNDRGELTPFYLVESPRGKEISFLDIEDAHCGRYEVGGRAATQ